MAVLPILHFPDERLQRTARPVLAVDARIRQLAADMLETMYAAHGIGLAATQVNVDEQIIVIDISEEKNAPQVLINPTLLWQSEERVEGDEGCLSVPGIYEKVQRAAEVRVRALDAEGAERDIAASGLLAVCIQHEMDHLKGRLFVDYLSALKRGRIRTRLLKEQRQAQREEKERVRREGAA